MDLSGKAFIMSSNVSKQLVKGAFVLTLAGIISKILSAGYRIPLQNITGNIGFYIYQQVYPLLGMAMVLALYGFPAAVSKLTADMKAGGYNLSVREFYGPVFLILLMVNGLFFLFLYVKADAIARWVGDMKLLRTYQTAAFVFLLIPFSSLLRGVFQGTQMMKPTAYSQIGEQILRVLVIISAAAFLADSGSNIYHIGEAAGLASISGSFLAILILALFFVKSDQPIWRGEYSIPWKNYMRSLFLLGIVAALNHMILLIMQLADAFTLVPGLIDYGLSKQAAMADKGIFDRGQPLIQLGTVLGSSFALAFIPSLSKRSMQNDQIQAAFAVSFYLAAGAAIGLIMIFPETNLLLYQDKSGTRSLQILAFATFLSAIIITASSILQGLGYIKRMAGFIVGAFLLKLLANMFFVPIWGIVGGAVATGMSLTSLLVAVLIELKKRLPTLSFFKSINWITFLKASIGMIVYILIIDYLLPAPAISRFGLLVWVVFTALTGAMIYTILLLRGGAFTEEELAMLPFAKLFIKLHKGRKS